MAAMFPPASTRRAEAAAFIADLDTSDEDIDAIVDDDGTFKRPPLRKGALIPDQRTKQLIRNAIAKAGM